MKTAEDGARFDFVVADMSTPCDVGSTLEGCVAARVGCVAGGLTKEEEEQAAEKEWRDG
jgi:hypothetical protein